MLQLIYSSIKSSDAAQGGSSASAANYQQVPRQATEEKEPDPHDPLYQELRSYQRA